MKSQKINYFKYFSLFFAITVLVFIAGCTGAPPTTPIINSFSASPSTITVGDSSTLSWGVTDATSVTIDHGVGSVASTTGNTSVSPAATTVYTLTATNATGSVTATTTVTVNPVAITYGSIDINSSPAGAKVYLDGVDTGMITPIVLPNIAAGTHAIKLDKYHYKIKEETNVSVTTGVTTYLNWSLTYATAETLTLQPGSEGKDSDVSEFSPNNNSGSYAALWLGYNVAKWRAYLEFDLSPNPLPAGAVVTNANLYLYQFYGSGSVSIGVYKVISNWGESSITWNTQPSSSSVAEDSYYFGSSTGTWRTWYIVDLVKSWLDGSISNYGILLKPTDESSNTKSAYFRSSDYTSDTSKRPKLEIYYYIP
jgi:hypothetical protein